MRSFVRLVLALVLFALPGITAAQEDVPTAPVAIDGTTLFRVRGVSSYPAEARAGAIAARILEVANDSSVVAETIAAVAIPSGGARRISGGPHLIMHVVEADAAVEGVTLDALAAAHVQRIYQAVTSYRAARSPAAIRGAALRTLIATFVLVGSLALLFWLGRRLDRRIRQRLDVRIHTVGIQSFEVVRAEQIRMALRSVLLGVRAIVLITAALVYAGFVLSTWPSTRALAHDVKGFALGPLQTIANGVLANIPRLLFLAVLYVVIRIVLRLIRMFFDAVERGSVELNNFDREWSQPTYKIVRLAVVGFGLVVAYPYIPGSDSAAFKGVSLFVGVMFSLGSSTAIANIVAGYMMTYRRAFKVGDRVQIDDTIGEVSETRLQVTHLRTLKNEEVIVPNSHILTSSVVNYTSLARQRGLILHTEVGIGYETPWRQVEAMLIEAADRVPGLAPAPRPFVLLKRLGDFAVVYELNVYCQDVSQMMATYSAMHRQILDVFNEYGVQIMTPAYEGDPAEPKIVPRQNWYTAPAVPFEAVTGPRP